MNIAASQPGAPKPVPVLRLDGKLDSSNYTDFIRRAQELFDNGSRNLVIDMQQLTYMSSAGLMALHTVARMFGESRDGQEETANSYLSIDPQADRAIEQHVRLVAPQPAVMRVLEAAGLRQFFEIFNDLDTAIQSFAE